MCILYNSRKIFTFFVLSSQIDVIHQLVARYPEDLHWATSVADIEAARAEGKIASLVCFHICNDFQTLTLPSQIGVESGHAIGSSLPLVRTLYRMGARYMTLTHGCNTPWADAAQVEVGDFPPRVGGLSEFGEKVRRHRGSKLYNIFEGCPGDEQARHAGGSLPRV